MQCRAEWAQRAGMSKAEYIAEQLATLESGNGGETLEEKMLKAVERELVALGLAENPLTD